MAIGIKGYLSGMSQDGAKNKENKNSYYSIQDFRVVTDGGKSTGSLENEKGHRISFIVPDLEEMTLADGTIIPQQTNLKIIGWGTIVDTIVIFTTSENSLNPTTSYGQIWKMVFNETSGDIIGLDPFNNLTVSSHLVYNQQLNFTSYHRIGRVIGRYETAKIQRVYWTDNFNSVRSINIADPDSLNIPLENLTLQPGINFSQPVIVSIDSGNLPTGCEIQFGYRLFDSSGAQSLISPLSALCPLPNQNIYSGSFGAFKGTGNPSIKSKSVTYTIKDIDDSYDTIEHFAVLYTAPNVFTAYKFDEQPIPDSGEVTITCSDLDTAIEITTLELNLLTSGFDKCKDIEVKDDRLIAANIKTEILDLDYDARAYRFNSGGNSLLQDSNQGDITINGFLQQIISGPGAGTSWTNVLETHNAINPYNNENSSSWFTNQYKFKTDGTTLGGEGPNVSYEFVKKEIPANFNVGVTTIPDHVSVNRWSVVDPDDIIDGQLHGDGTDYTIERTNQFKNFAAPYNHSYFRGYARGEVYRFGIVFWNKKGSTSYVNWIGDIRIPDVEDGFPIGTDVGGLPYMYSIGIKFNVDISSIQDKISGYSIVRVKREEADKTKLGNGLLMYFDMQDDTYESSILHRYETFLDGSSSPSNPYQLTNNTNIFNSLDTLPLHLADKPGFNDPQRINNDYKRVCYLLSPMGQLYPVSFKAGDFLKTTGYQRGLATKYYMDGGSDNDKSYGFYYKMRTFVPYTHSREWYEIGGQEIMQIGQYYAPGSAIISPYVANSLMNASYCRDAGPDANVPLGLGSPKMLIGLTSTPTITNNSGDPAITSAWETNPDYRAMVFGGDETITQLLFKEVHYCRYNANQYGGNTYADRSKNEYIATNHYQILTDTTPTTFDTEVFGGDVFVNYYDEEQIQMYWNQSTAFGQPYDAPIGNKLSIAACFFNESPCNSDWRTGRHWAADRDSTNMGAYESNQYDYNFVWSQESIAQKKFFAKDFLLETNEESPHQLWASEPKIDGELLDKWRVFKPANRTEVNGVYGPINRIINYKDRLFFYQDAAVGIASINERSIITDQSGQQAVLGTGGIFPDYTYISTITGSYHQFCVVPTENGLYHYDARLRKVFKATGGEQPISDLKGMSSFFDNKIVGEINKADYTLRTLDGGPTGVHGEADYRYNRVLFTFLMPFIEPDGKTELDIIKGTIIFYEDEYFEALADFHYNPAISADFEDYNTLLLEDYSPSYTVSYNEMLDAFEGFYSYKPGLYLQYGRRLMSVSPFNSSEAYTHNEGSYCEFYGQLPTRSKLITYLGDQGNTNKIFNNLEFLSESYDTNGNDTFTDTVNRLRVRNEYQDTGSILLINNTNIKRRMRTWRLAIPRDNTDNKSRIRNPWAELTLEYQNGSNQRFILHEIGYNYLPAPL